MDNNFINISYAFYILVHMYSYHLIIQEGNQKCYKLSGMSADSQDGRSNKIVKVLLFFLNLVHLLVIRCKTKYYYLLVTLPLDAI
jgi:hypothetical protein